MKQVTFIAINQDNYHYILYSKHPRKELMELLGATRADKMYIEEGRHIGYVIAGHWFTLYKATRIDNLTGNQ